MAEQEVEADFELEFSASETVAKMWPAFVKSTGFLQALANSPQFMSYLATSPAFQALVQQVSSGTVGPTMAQGLTR
jgi:hypothetical protein